MDLSLGARDPRFAAGACSLLYNWSESPTLVQIDNLVDGFIGQQARLDEFLESSGNVRTGFAGANGVSMFLFLGATLTPTVARAVGSWLEPRHNRQPTGFCTGFQQQADLAAARFVTSIGPLQRRILIFGYSVGGAVALALGVSLANADPANVVTVVTFGQPRPGDDRMVQACRRVDYHAYWNEGDNLRFCPPNSREAFTLHLLLTGNESLTINQLGHLDQATKISEQEELSVEPASNEGDNLTDLSLTGFLISNEAPTSRAHAIAEYNRRLTIWEARNPPPPFRPRAANAIGVPQILVPPQAVVQAGPQRPSDPTTANIPRRPIAPKKPRPPYRAVRSGKTWTVVYNGGIVGVYKVKTEAKRFASRMNSAYGLWRNAPAFDGPAFEASVADLFQS